ncbi:MAG: phospholipase D-like domain-containing protein [Betaproteobacteria bacterium]|nr:phospholipase D-like domain-containing protein [Betaproteobacteria bacterium]
MRPGSFVPDNYLTLLDSGREYFPALIKQINQAQVEIYFETYIFYPDEVGRTVMRALQQAALRGVRVHVITDWFGTGIRLCRLLKREFEKFGIHFRTFNPWFYRGLARQHRKVCVIDHQHAFVGGINILDDFRYDYSKKQKILKAPRWDFAVLIEGPVLNLIQQEVEAFWERVGHMPIRSRIRKYRISFKQKSAIAKVALAGFVVRDNFRNRRTIQRAYLRAMGRARHKIVLATPYFAPGRKFRAALISAAKRGVQVTLLIGIGEFWWQDAVAKSFFPKLLKSGVRVYEYRKTQLHGKVAAIDDAWATVGSSNCDGLSLFINHEANVIVGDTQFVATLHAHILNGVAEAEEIRLEDFERLPGYLRFWYGTAHLIYRSIMRVVTWGDYN